MPEAREERKDVARVALAAQCTNFKDLHAGSTTSANTFANNDTGSSKPLLETQSA